MDAPLWISAAAAVVGAGISGGSARQSYTAGKRAESRQQKAQRDAEAQALRQSRESAEAEKEARRKTPDLSSLLAAEQQDRTGPSSTLLTQASESKPKKPKLGESSLLGG